MFYFLKDTLPGGFIKTARLPADPFELTMATTVPTIGDDAAQLAANPAVHVLPPYHTGAANTEDLVTRVLVQVPQAYLPLVLKASLTPREAWEQLGVSIIANGHAQQLAHLLGWLRVALTLRVDAADPNGAALTQAIGLGKRRTRGSCWVL